VGPVWRGGGRNEAALLAGCYRNSLEIARANDIETIAFPAISCGVYGYPLDEAARIAVQTIRAFVREHGTPREVLLVCFTPEVRAAYTRALQAAD
jgi:O-acetyl-ADP-ribose deacetylase (regulator of RNase III)